MARWTSDRVKWAFLCVSVSICFEIIQHSVLLCLGRPILMFYIKTTLPTSSIHSHDTAAQRCLLVCTDNYSSQKGLQRRGRGGDGGRKFFLFPLLSSSNGYFLNRVSIANLWDQHPSEELFSMAAQFLGLCGGGGASSRQLLKPK